MKIYIGPYRHNLIDTHYLEITYDLWRAEKDKTKIDGFVYSALDIVNRLVSPINRWYSNRKRKIKIHIDNYDVWSMDHTLALIILPMLNKLKESTHGAPYIAPIDVPEHIRPKEEASPDNGYIDDTHYERWAYVLDEMIWAFEQHAADNEWSMKFIVYDEDGNFRNFDKDGHDKHRERVLNGRILFARYYTALWD